MRLGAVLALALLLAPSTWIRTTVGGRHEENSVISRLNFNAPDHAGFSNEGVWQLTGLSENFGGYSAIGWNGGASIRLFSDKGWLLTIPRPDRGAGSTSLRQLYPVDFNLTDLLDIESVTHNRQTGQYWVGYEYRHTIYRYSVTGEPEAWVQPEFTRGWADNSGMEAIVRLEDGRFIVLHETGSDGYLYNGDPVEGAVPQFFPVAYPEGYAPTDMAELPDGRVLILLRTLDWHLPVFSCMLAIADPAQIDSQDPWQVTPLIQLEQLVPRDNYEGLAVEPGPDGELTLWLASDDNKSAFQRSLLAKLSWDPAFAAASAEQ